MNNDPTYQEAAITAVAEAVARFYKALVEEGLPPDHALEIVKAWVIETSRRKPE